MSLTGTPEHGAALFEAVCESAQRTVRPLLRSLLETLDGLGCGSRADFGTFERETRAVLRGFFHDPPGSPPFAQLRVTATPPVRTALAERFLYTLGMDRADAASTAKRLSTLRASAFSRSAAAAVSLAPAHTEAGQQQWLAFDLRHLFHSATRLRDRLTDIDRTVNRPYAGDAAGYGGHPTVRPSNETLARRGIAQTVELLQMFPELADTIYRGAGLRGLKGFPPQSSGAATGEATTEFIAAVDAQLRCEAGWGVVSVIALAAAGIMLTTFTAGIAGPMIGMAAGGSLGLGAGGAQVLDARSRLEQATDTHRFGAGSETRIAFLEREVRGAWGMLLADVVTGGVLGRLGGAANIGRVLQTVRTTAISGAGTGIGAATNPNTWASPDVAGVLLKATVVGALAGGTGQVAGSSLARRGSRVMLGLSRQTGPLRPGAVVNLAGRGASTGTRGRVLSVEDTNVRVATPQGEITYQVSDVAIATAQYRGASAPRSSAAIRADVEANVATSRAARASSNFRGHSKAEGRVQEDLRMWPPNRGAYGPVQNRTLQPGEFLDRYGHPGGKFVSPAGSPFKAENPAFSSRALPSAKQQSQYTVYEVVKPIENVPQSKILPWFGQPGQGVQYELPKKVQWYIENGYLRPVRAGNVLLGGGT